ncbi:MAG: class I SAM-dependent methyltransferase [Chitinophagales bacterium]
MNFENQLAFDLAASAYDEEFTHSLIGKLQRQRVYFFLKKILTDQSLRILEINCGSGEDAVWLAQQGHHVTATDASPKMIELVRKKISESKLEEKISTAICDFDDLKNKFQSEKFDFIFSDFGGLNCVSGDELEKLSADFSSLLVPGGKFIAVIMGRKCWWERSYFLMKGKSRDALRRNSKELVEAKIGESTVPTWYYSPKEFQNLFLNEFQKIRVRPVGLFIPPSYLNPFFEKKKWLLSILNLLEKMFSLSFLSDFADHFLIELIKR